MLGVCPCGEVGEEGLDGGGEGFVVLALVVFCFDAVARCFVVGVELDGELELVDESLTLGGEDVEG